jgi:hypothetical protein
MRSVISSFSARSTHLLSYSEIPYIGFLIASSYFQASKHFEVKPPIIHPGMEYFLRGVCPLIAAHNVQVKKVGAKQLWDKFDSDKSDHKPWLYSLGAGHNALIFNLMMRGIKKRLECGSFRFNNGYGKEETREAYQLRLALLAVDEICNILRNNSSIDILFCEEGPVEAEDIKLFVSKIREQKIPGWEDICFAKTPWGVATCFKSNAVARAFFHDESLAQELGILMKRCDVFVSSDNNRLVHLHGEHGNPEKFYKDVLTPILMDRMAANPEHRFTVDTLLGDKNLSPAQERKVLLEAYSDALAELAISGKKYSPLFIDAELTSSDAGHIKLKAGDAEEQEHHTVDSALKLVSRKIEEEEFRRGPNFHRRVLGLMFCGGALITAEGTFDLGLSEAGMLVAMSNVARHQSQQEDEETSLKM